MVPAIFNELKLFPGNNKGKNEDNKTSLVKL